MRSDESPDDVKNLEKLADKVLSVSEKIDGEDPLSAEEVAALRKVKRAFRDAEERPGMPRWTFLAAAAAILIAALGLFASFYLSGSLERESTLTLAMRPARGTRSPASWTSGDAFVIEASLSADLFLHVVHLDAKSDLEFVFPLYDPDAKRWNYLGHRDNHVEQNMPLSIPASDFPMTFTIGTDAAGEEFLIAFASSQGIAEDALSKLRTELREAVERAKQEGADGEAIAARVKEIIAKRFPGPQTVRRYTVD